MYYYGGYQGYGNQCCNNGGYQDMVQDMVQQLY